MRTIPAAMEQILASGDFTGPQKAVARVVVTPSPFLGIYPINDWLVDREGREAVQQTFSSIHFRQVKTHGKEMPNVKSIKWSRSTQGEIGSCTIEMWNTLPLPPGTGPDKGDSFDLLGYYTFNRGRTQFSQTNWGHDQNEWRDVLVPDSMLVTYQGYGSPNYNVVPEKDPAVLQTGLWLIDDVTYTADGLITVECRDAARLLADQISFPPVVPRPLYPQKWEPYVDRQPPARSELAGTGWTRPAFHSSSVGPYYGFYPNGNVYGHYERDAFDANEETYWLSVGNVLPNGNYSKEWLAASPGLTTLTGVRARVVGGPYTCFLSVKKDGVWQGARKIDYTPPNNTKIDNGSGIHYYLEPKRVARDGEVSWSFPALTGVTEVRITFTDLFNFGIGAPFRHRVGVRTMEVNGSAPVNVTPPVQKLGNFGDYTDIVRVLLAWGGFFWPQNGKQYLTNDGAGGNTNTISFAEGDPFLTAETRAERLDRNVDEVVNKGRELDSIRRSVDRLAYGNSTTHFEPLPTDLAQDAPHLPPPLGTGTLATLRTRIENIYNNRGVRIARGEGRIWGDLQQAGTASKTSLGVEIWDKKPLLDCITYIKDILGFILYVDEHGAAQWRSPNTFRLGNWLSGSNGLSTTRTLAHLTIRDNETIVGLRAKLSSRNVRDFVFVANVNGKIGATSAGRLPSAGFRRVGGWTDQNFETTDECQIMADMITLRQMFTYRQNSVRIPADPRIQVDDQVLISERTTSEQYMHYVSSIDSNWDLESGEWHYDLTTSWLGTDPAGEWAFKTTGLAQVTLDYLRTLGQV